MEELQTQRLRICAFDKRYLEDYALYLTEEITRYQYPDPFASLEDAEALLDGFLADMARGKMLELAVLSLNGTFLGACLLYTSLNVHWVLLLVIFIVFCAFINIFMFSATAQWFMFAPVFIPMLMTIGISPEMTQLAYRIGDSCTNAISPMSPYIPFIIALMQKYKKDAGMGTHFATLVPYAFGFLVDVYKRQPQIQPGLRKKSTLTAPLLVYR